MSTRERDRPEREGIPSLLPQNPGGAADPGAERREQLLARGRAAIDEALSQDSAAFLNQRQQQGGQ